MAGILLCAGLFWYYGAPAAMGGNPEFHAANALQAEERLRLLREEQNVRAHREDILRARLEALESAPAHTVSEMQLREAREDLLKLLADGRTAEQEILQSLHELWKAQDIAQVASQRKNSTDALVRFVWPVSPELGISAHFHDAGYQKRFGMQHDAIDIPAPQGSLVRAAADGVVEKAVDNGLGFNALVLRHDGGFATLYGHVSAYLVQEGQEVAAGEPVALSGGMPGTAGAGKMTTGPHLHFELLRDGVHVNPEEYLPREP